MSALDMALLLNCASIVNYLLKHGATLSLLGMSRLTIQCKKAIYMLLSV